MLVSAVLVLTVCSLLLLWALRRSRYWYHTTLPHIPGLPFVGNFLPILLQRTSFTQLYATMYADPRVRHAACFGIHHFYHPAVVVRSPQLARQMLATDFTLFADRFARSGRRDPHGRHSIQMSSYALWRQLHGRLAPLFSNSRLRQKFSVFVRASDDLHRSLAAMQPPTETGVLEVRELVSRYSTDVIAGFAFGVRAHSLRKPECEFRRKYGALLHLNWWRNLEFLTLFFAPEWMDVCGFRVFNGEMTTFMNETMAYLMEEREKVGEQRADMIDTLIEMKRDGFNADVRNAQASIVFMNGSEGGASTIAFALHELALHPDAQQLLKTELKAALSQHEDDADVGPLTYETVAGMQYLHQVVAETLRMHPFSMFLNRRCTLPAGQRAYSLQPHADGEIADGCSVHVPVAAIQRDPLYWPEPDCFRPERFAPENRASLVPAAYMPFGCGPRICLAERFGTLQTKLGLVGFLRGHTVLPVEKAGVAQTRGAEQYSKMTMFLQVEGGISVRLRKDNDSNDL